MTITLSPGWLAWPQTARLTAAFAPAGELRFVGGAVRDALLGIEATDVDAATVLHPQAVMDVLQEAGIQAIPTGIAHGTVTALVDDRHFEITTLRRDTSCDGRHAEVEYTNDWKEDASRRDFTMNALYLSVDGTLFDFFGGVDDARKGHVRFIGDAETRIREDYLRILRFFRFHAWYGKTAPDAAALSACVRQASHMKFLSGERIQHELLRLFAARRASETVSLIQEHALVPSIIGFDVRDSAVFARFEAIERLLQAPLDPAFKLSGWIANAAMLSLPEALGMVYDRLRLSNRTEKMLRQCVRYHGDITPGMALPQQKRLLRRLGAEAFSDAVILAWAQGEHPISETSPFHDMLSLAQCWRLPVFPVTGKDLVGIGHKPGKGMGELLTRLEEIWEASDYTLGKQELLDRAGPA
jgi:poly(A) polymerase